MTEPLDLDAIKARERAATKGPWKAKPTGRGRCDGISPDYHDHDGSDCDEADSDDCPAMSEIVTTDSGVYGPTWPDAEFIAHAREDIPALLAEVARLRAVVASPEVVEALRAASPALNALPSPVPTLTQIRERIKNLQRWSVGDNWGPGRYGDDEECWPEGTEEDADGELVKWSDVLAIIDPPGASCAAEAPK